MAKTNAPSKSISVRTSGLSGGIGVVGRAAGAARAARAARAAEWSGPPRRGMSVHAFGVRGFGVLSEVDAGGLVLGAEPETHEPVDDLGQHIGNRERVDGNDHGSEQLLAQL